MKPTKDQLSAIAKALHPALAESIEDGSADVTSFAVPGLPDSAAWRIRIDAGDHPVQTYAGLWPDGSARILSDDQPAFFDLVVDLKIAIDDSKTALGYVLAFLEVTRGPTVIVRQISGAGDIRWRPGTAEEELRREAFLQEQPVAPPSSERKGDGFHVKMWLIVDQRIQLNTFDVARDGKIESSYRVVASDLPLPIAR